MSIQHLQLSHVCGTTWRIDDAVGPPWRVNIFNSDSQEFESLDAFSYIGVWDAAGSLLVNVDGELVVNA